MDRYDIIINGASIAGCAAAILLAEQGNRVALVEARSSSDSYKVLCTHHIHGCGSPVLDRIGVTDELLRAGMVETVPKYWTRWGWISPDNPVKHGLNASYNIRRETLDPIVRKHAAAHPNVDLHLGLKTQSVVFEHGRAKGLVCRKSHGEEVVLQADLIVGADGKHSKIAECLGSPTRIVENGRFSYFAYLSNIERPDDDRTLSWFLDPDVAYLMPNDGDLSVLAVIPEKSKYKDFENDRTAAYLDFVNRLPGAPRVGRENIAGKIIGTVDYPLYYRDAARSGAALIGDAVGANDPLWGIGCAWALLSAQWLADSIGNVASKRTLDGYESIDAALRTYERRRSAGTKMHTHLMQGYASGRRLNLFERILYSAAARDSTEANRFHAFGSRQISASSYLAAPATLRAALGRLS
ncbi:NAD(P)/FAD-dependent oxidoreductase [Tsukamurella ocularis]|uniref:NAD(P)/FAD-dependent oxidoreductase n=1 Tax=Tsukamurella ocularis TaxID=1970234 RepID=UPI0021679FD0|nr:NAD(P)/FAD-dependent oxidoreductase [Tsukamurella ocularis]MCS3779330.1 2-polyprenyl-6-methoxyphenol hydroxylase-like FAD-dependent oxidoreductase [Tsukamurella ocularis]MCS3789944.1 2-polyprenyl-6-methoxyphenol hydroxylase-like FAD-dependent oxidoreductase [Tsukamurella ocularis]MCS3852441.1 2-polyprenyl-6-methoxyphenol hydroxylase-like FAD-dependent oxidoreductase [Tsukamurella ocularis]